MEPLTSTVAISTIVGYLAKKLRDNKSIQNFFDDFTEATVNWIKPVLVRQDGIPEKALRDLQEKPDSIPRQEVIKSSIAVALEDNPDADEFIQEMAKLIEDRRIKGESIFIENSKNVNAGTINAGGNITLGDNNKINK